MAKSKKSASPPESHPPRGRGRVHRRRAALPAAAVRGPDRPGTRRGGARQRARSPAASPTRTCSPAPAASARPAPRASSPRRSTARRARPRRPATSATVARRSPRAKTWTCWRSTARATTRWTRSATSGRTSASAPPAAGTRSTSSTKSTCSRPPAFNALLKTLEEPPPTREVHPRDDGSAEDPDHDPVAVPAVRLRPRRPGQDLRPTQAASSSAKGHQADDDALKLVARRAGGSMRDSQSLLDQLLASSTGQAHRRAGQRGARHRRRRTRHRTRRPPSSTATPKTALDLIAAWVERGLQIGELVDQTGRILAGADARELRRAGCARTPGHAVADGSRSSKHARAISASTRYSRGWKCWTATQGPDARHAAHAGAARDGGRAACAGSDELLSVGQLVQAAQSARCGLPARGHEPHRGQARR